MEAAPRCRAFMDGSVRYVMDSIDRRIWAAIATRAGGEVVGDDAW